MGSKRILWLDQLKAVAFFFVILGHMSITGGLKDWIYSFHMPLFFLVSGFTLNLDKLLQTRFRDHFSKLFKRMVIPYVWIEMICLCFSYLTTVMLKHKQLDLTENLIGIAVSNGLLYPYPSRPLYFALVLFLAQVLLWLVVKASKGNRIAVFLITLALCTFSVLTIGKPMVWRVNVVPVAMLLMLVGTLLRLVYARLQTRIEHAHALLLWLCGAVLFAGGFVLQKWNGRLSMAGNRYGNVIPVGLLAAILTSCALALFLMKLPSPKVMTIIGQNTFFYMGFHRPLITLLETLFPSFKSTPWFLAAGSLFIFFGLVPAVLLTQKTSAFLLCKETKGQTPWTIFGKLSATALAFIVPYGYAFLHLANHFSLSQSTTTVLTILSFLPVCAAIFLVLQKWLPVAYLYQKE